MVKSLEKPLTSLYGLSKSIVQIENLAWNALTKKNEKSQQM